MAVGPQVAIENKNLPSFWFILLFRSDTMTQGLKKQRAKLSDRNNCREGLCSLHWHYNCSCYYSWVTYFTKWRAPIAEEQADVLEWGAGKGGAVKLSVAQSHCGVCIHSLLVLVYNEQHKTLSGQNQTPAASECTSLWFITLQLEPVSGDGAVTVLHVWDAVG